MNAMAAMVQKIKVEVNCMPAILSWLVARMAMVSRKERTTKIVESDCQMRE